MLHKCCIETQDAFSKLAATRAELDRIRLAVLTTVCQGWQDAIEALDKAGRAIVCQGKRRLGSGLQGLQRVPHASHACMHTNCLATTSKATIMLCREHKAKGTSKLSFLIGLQCQAWLTEAIE